MDEVALLNNAVRSGDIEEVKNLLDGELKGKPEVLNGVSGNASPLLVACQLSDSHKSQEMIRFLLSRGADVNFEVWGSSVLLKAVREQYKIDTIRCLLEEPKVDLQNDSLLLAACQNGDAVVVDLLLERGAKVNVADHSPLTIACKHGNFEIVKLLLDKGADVNAVTNKDEFFTVGYRGKSPLLIAMECDHPDIVELLLNKEAKIIDQTKTHKTNPGRLFLRPDLAYYPRNPYSTEVSKVLMEKEVDYLSTIAKNGESPLLIYTISGQRELVKMCLGRGDDVNKADSNGVYPLWCAVKQSHYEIFELLMKKGAKLSMCPNNEKSALEMIKGNSELLAGAIENKNYECAEFLVNNGAEMPPLESIRNSLKSLIELLKEPNKLEQCPNFIQKLSIAIRKYSKDSDDSSEGSSDDNSDSESQLESTRKRRRESSTDEDFSTKRSRLDATDISDKALCPICDEKIRDVSDSIFCGGSNCNGRIHRQCAGLSRKEFECASNSPPFICPKCDLSSLKDEVSAMRRNFMLKGSAPRKKFSIIVQGIEECAAGTAMLTRQREDLDKVISVLSKVDDSIQPQAIRDHHRLGKYNQARQRPRPILVQFLRSADVSRILSKTSAVESPSIQHYMTPTELARNKILLKKRWAIHTETGTDLKLIKIRKHSIFVEDCLHGTLNTTDNHYESILK